MVVLVIGHGIAGATAAWFLERSGANVKVAASSTTDSATRKAAGLVNPVVLKRMQKVWYADEAMKAYRFYADVESHLGVPTGSYHTSVDMFHRFASVEEQNDCSLLRQRDSWSRDLGDISMDLADWKGLNAPLGGVQLKRVHAVDTVAILDALQQWHVDANRWIEADVGTADIRKEPDGSWLFRGTLFDAIVWANGTAITHFPIWKNLPIRPNYGSWIEVEAPSDVGLDSSEGFHSKYFVLPRVSGSGKAVLHVGSTYNPKPISDLDNEKDILRDYLQSLRTNSAGSDLRVSNQIHGIRPTSADRRPMYGEHPHISGAYMAGGLGSRGLLHAPALAEKLAQCITEGKQVIPEAADVRRFSRRLRDCTL